MPKRRCGEGCERTKLPPYAANYLLTVVVPRVAGIPDMTLYLELEMPFQEDTLDEHF